MVIKMKFTALSNYQICTKCKSENVEIVFNPEIGEFYYECQECGYVWTKNSFKE